MNLLGPTPWCWAGSLSNNAGAVPGAGHATPTPGLPSFEGSFNVVTAQLGDDATVRGAAGWAREMVQARR